MSNRRLFICALFCACLGAPIRAATISYSVTPIGSVPGDFQYTYFLSGFDFVTDEEIDLEFPANQFAAISNATVSPGFDVQLFQPNEPLGAPGDFTVLALSNLGNVAAPWSIDVAYIGTGSPGAQTYFIDQFDSNGVLIGTPVQAQDVAAQVVGPASAPEPGTCGFLFLGVGLLAGYRLSRRARYL